jgi:rhodanese-related sulfurtransferase
VGDSAKQIEPDGERLAVMLASGRVREADLVVLSVGVRPESELAAAAGLGVAPRGGIRVNAHMQTDDPLIYAVGDATEVNDSITGQPVQVPLAGPAARQGRIAADHALGRDARYRGTQATAIVRVFGCTAAMTGASETTLRRLGTPYAKVYTHPKQHAGYYPGAVPITLKLLFEPGTGRLLGAQAVGQEGVDKRIDVLAVALAAGMTVFDLEQLELAYSPQYGAAKDPINMLGFVAAGMLRGDHPQTTVDALAAAGPAHPLRDGSAAMPQLLDVRTREEFAAGHIGGAINVPLDELRERLEEIDRRRPVIAYCQVGQRGYAATRILSQRGFLAANLSGGYQTYDDFRATGALAEARDDLRAPPGAPAIGQTPRGEAPRSAVVSRSARGDAD